MGAVWYTSDLHFMHDYVAGLRGFSNTNDHDEAIISNWNASVAPNDIVILCGDLTLKKPEVVKPLVDRLNGAIHFIWGNHDYGSPIHRDGYKYSAYYTAQSGLNLDSAESFMRRKLNGQQVLISHYPYAGDHGDDRYTQYRLRNEGLPIIHGHTHLEDVISYGAMTLQIHVGLDAHNLKPVHQEDIIKILKDNQ